MLMTVPLPAAYLEARFPRAHIKEARHRHPTLSICTVARGYEDTETNKAYPRLEGWMNVGLCVNRASENRSLQIP